jgi:FkbM family methyltransferase
VERAIDAVNARSMFNIVTETKLGPMLVNGHDAYVGRSLLTYGEFSPGEARLFAHLLKPGMIALDIGANIGAHTMLMAESVGETGLVLAFEPQRFVFHTLVANVALQSRMNVQPLLQAVGAERGTIKVPTLDPRVDNNFGGLSIEGHGIGDTVPVIRLDDLTIPHCALVKIDVEGMETSVLRGGRKFLARTQPVLYVEADREEKKADLYAELTRQDYLVYSHDPPLYEPGMYRDGPNIFGEIVSANWLCLPKAREIPCDFPKVTL